METWVLKLLLCINLPLFISGDGKYECGEHGRFEYCIDGTPDCVIGCYCHPGYYFDTESKICEHNSKLTLKSKGMYAPEPLTPGTSFIYTTKATDTINNKFETMDKSGTDDLSDWLYNQFFKTVENQVINKTDDKPVSSRRSGSRSIITRVKPKRHKKSKLKKNKNKDLRRKLLRITEDDSIFKSSSSGSSEESGSSDTSSGSSESTSSSKEDKEQDNHKNHKKLIMYQKRPKPALPSFIFLPNAGDTPYFPPIGLPAPAPLPMYPMAPVPPMVFVAPTDKTSCDGATTKKTEDHTHHHQTTVHHDQTTVHHDQTTAHHDETTVHHTTAEPSTKEDETMEPLEPDATTEGQVTEATSEPNPDDATTPSARMKLLRKFPSKFMRKQLLSNRALPFPVGKGKQNKPNNVNLSPNQRFRFLEKLNQKHKSVNPPDEYMDDPLPFKLQTPPERMNTRRNIINNLLIELSNLEDHQKLQEPETQDVDFKYLTELIHNKNSSKLFTRRNIGGFNRNKPDDAYYSSLGKEIATLIRKEEGAFDDGTAHANPKYLDQLQFYENSHSPRSYWERSVRSPFLNINSNGHEGARRSNDNLMELENKVEIVASTTPKLKLEDLEDIVAIATKSRLIRKKARRFQNLYTDGNNLKVSLMPVNVKLFLDNNMKNYITRRFNSYLISKNYIEPNKSVHVESVPVLDTKNSKKVSNIHKLNENSPINPEINKRDRKLYETLSTEETKYPEAQPKLSDIKYSSNNNNSGVIARSRSSKIPYLRNPIILNHKNMKYVPKIRETHFKNFYSPYYRPFETSIRNNFSPVHFFV